MRLRNQNIVKNGVIHHEECDENGDGFCPVKALAQRVISILKMVEQRIVYYAPIEIIMNRTILSPTTLKQWSNKQ